MAIVHHASMIIFIRRSGQLQAGVMKSVVIKRSILLNGRKTSVSLENEFWHALHEIADRENVAVSAVVEQIDKDRDNINLSSAIRLFILNHFRPQGKMETMQAAHLGRHGANNGRLRARAEECRALAETFNDVETREIMLRVAADYEVLADRLEQRRERGTTADSEPVGT
jgi:predicted DNA-binding ribbon-helix-helix protein